MPKINGRQCVVMLDSDDLSTHSNNAQLEITSDSHDVTTFGKTAHVFQGGLLNGTAAISGFYDSTAGTGPRAVIRPLVGTVVPFTYRPEGTGSGKPQEIVDALVIKYTETAPVADMITWAVDLQFSDTSDTTAQAA